MEKNEFKTLNDLFSSIATTIENNKKVDYNFENLEIEIPSEVDNEKSTIWKFNGKVSIESADK
jgi:hypothetical protein